MKELNSLLQNLGIERLLPLQEKMWETCRTAKGAVVLLAPTGSGKTLAVLLPLLERLSEQDSAAVCLAPTRELVLQHQTIWNAMHTGFPSVCLRGGHSFPEEQAALTNRQPKVVFATPGRLLDHLTRKTFSPDTTTLLLVDEFDKCFELGFRDTLNEIAQRFLRIQNVWLSSATDTPEIPRFLQKMSEREIVRLDFLHETETLSGLSFRTYLLPEETDKAEVLLHLLCTLGDESSIVFVETREGVELLRRQLSHTGLSLAFYHGGMEQAERERALLRFRCGAARTLVCTDLAARGLDIADVAHVVHFDLPRTAEQVIHRNGRTARQGKAGVAHFLLAPSDDLRAMLPDADLTPSPLPTATLPPPPTAFSLLHLDCGRKEKLRNGDIVGALCKQCDVPFESIGMISLHERHTYVAIASEAAKAFATQRKVKIKGKTVRITPAR